MKQWLTDDNTRLKLTKVRSSRMPSVTPEKCKVLNKYITISQSIKIHYIRNTFYKKAITPTHHDRNQSVNDFAIFANSSKAV